jgi:osmotically inducible lipoprotein OsmB
MKTQIKFISVSAVLVTSLVLGGCANLSHHDRNVVTGAGIGAVAGAVLTGGSAVGTVGGAAVGGVIGSTVRHR